MNLKFETIVNIFRKIMQINAVIILKSTNEYNQKIISKSDRKMDLYPALNYFLQLTEVLCLFPFVILCTNTEI